MCTGITDGMMNGMGLWGLLVIVTVVAVLVAAVLAGVWLVRGLRGDRSGANRAATGGTEVAETQSDNGAREMLRRRYAAGEIDEEEYERRLTGLTWR